MCNSCGHIPGSSKEATTYEEAIDLLDGLRLQRLQRVRRRQVNDSTALLQRLQQLPDRTKELARRFTKNSIQRWPISSRTTSPSSYPPYPPPRPSGSTRDRARTTTAAMFPSFEPLDKRSTNPAPRTAIPTTYLSPNSASAMPPLSPGPSYHRASVAFAMPTGVHRSADSLETSYRRASNQSSTIGLANRGSSAHPMPLFRPDNSYNPSSLPPLPPLQAFRGVQLRNTSPASYALGSYRQTDAPLTYPSIN